MSTIGSLATVPLPRVGNGSTGSVTSNQALQNLASALSSANVPAAQTAGRQLEQALKSGHHYHAAGAVSGTDSENVVAATKVASSLQALDKALASGNLGAALSAFQDLSQAEQTLAASKQSGGDSSASTDSSAVDGDDSTGSTFSVQV